VTTTSDSGAPYLVVADDLRRRIASGEFGPGAQLPTGRELAAEYGVAPNTVLSALRELRDEGLVTSQQGRGTFVRNTAVQALRSRTMGPDYELLSSKLDAIQNALQSLEGRVNELERIVQPARTVERPTAALRRRAEMKKRDAPQDDVDRPSAPSPRRDGPSL
jgi:GntR family transcriptional regulator